LRLSDWNEIIIAKVTVAFVVAVTWSSLGCNLNTASYWALLNRIDIKVKV